MLGVGTVKGSTRAPREHPARPIRVANTMTPRQQPVLSTPYHGYWKNLALAVAGKWDKHLTALWQGGHVKFFSIKTLGVLLAEVGFKGIRLHARRSHSATCEIDDRHRSQMTPRP